jgi:hypothetical protein
MRTGIRRLRVKPQAGCLPHPLDHRRLLADIPVYLVVPETSQQSCCVLASFLR